MPSRYRRLSDQDVRRILEDTCTPDAALAKALGCCESSVFKVRRGLSHADCCPELPRRQRRWRSYRHMTEREIRYALEAVHLSCRQVANELGRNHRTISKLRLGLIHGDVLPELKRPVRWQPVRPARRKPTLNDNRVSSAPPCPECGRRGRTIESRLSLDRAYRRRRHECASGHRWTLFQALNGTPLAPMPCARTGRQLARRPQPSPSRGFDEETIRFILTNKQLGATRLARQLGCSRQMVYCVLRGETYRDVLPQLPRGLPSGLPAPRLQLTRSCHRCQHWRGRCTMGFPDPAEEGPSFAMECALYDEQAAPLAA